MKFKEYKGLDLAQTAADVLGEWDARDTFHKSITTREGHPAFVFYEGPPSANGTPGIHHVMARTIKDVFCRYKTQQGYLVHRKAGWDTHGLPVELGVEKKLGITKEDIGKKITIEEYNRTCREAVMEFTGMWEDLTRKMGYWVNMDDPYITYDNKYIETLWWLLKQLFDKGLLYKGYTIQPYSPAAGTGLSTHELNQPGCYRDVKDTTCTAQFEVIRDQKSEKLFAGVEGPLYFLAWTTTPWTLPSNTALAVGPAIEYVKVKCRNPYTDRPQTVILAKELVPAYFTKKMEGTYEITGESWQGPELEGIRYEQLIPWVKPMGDAFRVIVGDYVTTSDGTGIVHIAPTFGADDDRVGRAAGIAPLFMVDKAGKNQPMVDRQGKFFLLQELDPEFVKNNVNAAKYKEYAGRYVKNAYDPNIACDAETTLDIDIAVMLKAENKAFKIEKHTHSYPHCWRTDKPVLYYPLDSWFIRTTALRERMIELNKTIRWKPESTGTGRFGKWLEGLVDWNLSRSRFWGTPLPVWATEDYSELKCIGSVEELMGEIEKSVAAGFMKENPYKNFKVGDMSAENYSTKNIDLHRPYVDGIVLVSSKGEPMKRESDLIDVWFDSGAMPYAQLHYPFENGGEHFKTVYPADFIAEGVDQTRGWFFTLHAIASMLFDSVAFKNIISNGLVLDKNGNKMSKRLGNGVDPTRRGQDMDNYNWIRDAEKNRLVVGTQARILYQDAEGRLKIALEFNRMVRDGEVGPIMLGRDHHDVSGTDSPFRETSNIRDGSNVMADMAVQCFAGNAARGMSLVALHNGGGVGIGKAINGGFGMVLDGSERVDEILRSAMIWDVMGGVARRSWARNPNAMRTSATFNENRGEQYHITLPYIPERAFIHEIVQTSLNKKV